MSNSESAALSPPRVPLVFSVGVTGHRNGALAGEEARVRAAIRDALRVVAAAANAMCAEDGHWFGPGKPKMQLISPLAEGTDQIAAEVALDEGFVLHAVLPFARADYRATLQPEAARIAFDALLARASCILELPGEKGHEEEAYVMTGRATVAHCELLLAVWDGQTPRGRGGTAEVVQLAITRGTPVLHLPVDPGTPPQLLWAAFDPAVLTAGADNMAARPFAAETLQQMLAAMLLPPAERQERAFLERFLAERPREFRARIEYPLLLAAAGVKRFGVKDFRNSRGAAATAEEWRCYRDGCVRAHAIDASLDVLEGSYSWADALATHFAQTHRSGHIFNFILGGIAVCLGLSGFMAPHARMPLAMVEFVITFAIILNTKVGTRGEWHRRWLDYRQLAERLRPMRSLKLLGIAAPDPPGTATNPVPQRWIDWYAGGVWRAMGCPAASIDRPRAAALAKAVAEYEVAPQVGYHDKSARQIGKLDERLESIATVLFGATLVVTVTSSLSLLLAPELVNEWNNWFTLISAGFPALGTAIFGIRFQADFGGSAVRSQATANALRLIDEELRRDVTLPRAADLAEQAARTMLGDLDEWRLVNQQHDLSVGA